MLLLADFLTMGNAGEFSEYSDLYFALNTEQKSNKAMNKSAVTKNLIPCFVAANTRATGVILASMLIRMRDLFNFA